MPDTKITALAAITTVAPSNDLFPIVDVSDNSMAASGTTKNITVNQLLGAGGIAALSSATITGDLTVATNRLSVSSTGVQIGTTTNKTTAFTGNGTGLTIGAALAPTIALWDTTNASYVGSISQIDADMYLTNTAVGQMVFSTDNTSRYTISSTGVATWSNVGGVAGTAMTLNATGLGVGVSPLYKLHAVVTSGAVGAFRASTAAIARLLVGNTVEDVELKVNANGDGQLTANASKYLGLGSNGLNDRVILDTAGNVGIGVTPSAWSSYKALQVGSIGSLSSVTGATIVGNNWFYDGASKYITTAASTIYEQGAGTHAWYSAASGTAGTAVSFGSAKMTLDASGNLLVGKTVNNITTVGFQSTSTGEVSAALAASTNAATQWTTYSTGAAAYRFYVGMGGTVFATNTTISAISDARFKENVQDIDVGLGAILALKPRKFDWKEGKGKNIKGDRGFIAQEFETVFPNLIDEWKENAPEGEAPYKSVRQDLIPVLVKAIQELTARVQTLETR